MRKLLFALPILAASVACVASSSETETVGSASSAATGAITEVTSFGTNPGALKMFEYAPANLAKNRPVVVVLHGCTETAANAAATGWNEIADAIGLTVVYPQQETGNNPIRCFNWGGEYGNPDNLTRGKGENLSIKEMVDKALADHGGDPKRVYVVGFSAGGGTAAIMAATYPDVFAGAAMIAGIPFNCTTTFSEVSSCMKPGKDFTPVEWGDKVRAAQASGYAGSWPKVSIWQGTSDQYVGPLNRTELVEQWTNVHGLPATPTASDTIDGQAHSVFKDAKGNTLVETFVIDGMAHGVPISSAQCGTASSYAIDKGICAAKHIATFFALAGNGTTTPDGGASSSSSSSSTSSSSSASGGASPKPDGGGATTEPSASSGGGGSKAAPTGEVETETYDSTCSVRALGSTDASGFASWGAIVAIAAAVLSLRNSKKGDRR
jgi:poly(hydroxyalkanoate) depolymerase family esterase